MASEYLTDHEKKLVQGLEVTLEKQIGRGYFGSVFRGLDKNGNTVAVKFCRKIQHVNYLEREVKIQLTLNQENLVRLYKFVVCSFFFPIPPLLFNAPLSHTPILFTSQISG